MSRVRSSMRWVRSGPVMGALATGIAAMYLVWQIIPIARSAGDYSRIAGLVVAGLALGVAGVVFGVRMAARARKSREREGRLHPACPKCGYPRPDIPAKPVVIDGVRVYRTPCPECGHMSLQ